MNWFRMYVDILDDPKVAEMTEKCFKTMTLLLAYCRELNSDGIIDIKKNNPTWRLRISENDFKAVIDELKGLSVISLKYNKLMFLNWNKRQYKSDDSYERVKRYRNVTRNITETLHETAPDTETDTETEKKKKKKKAVSFEDKNKNKNQDKNEVKYFIDLLPDKFKTNGFLGHWKNWVDDRKERKKEITKRAAKMHIKFLIQQPNPVKCINQSIEGSWTKLYPVKENNAEYGEADKINKTVELFFDYWQKNECSFEQALSWYETHRYFKQVKEILKRDYNLTVADFKKKYSEALVSTSLNDHVKA